MNDMSDLVVVGKITTVYGIKGWVKIHSYTDPMDNLLGYKRCFLKRKDGWQPLRLAASKIHGKGIVAQLEGVNDRELAREYCQCDIGVSAADLPELSGDDFYWHELEGLKVYTEDDTGKEVLLGSVDHMMETGANDVLVVKSCKGSVDQEERLIPWLLEQVILEVDITSGQMRVDWPVDF